MTWNSNETIKRSSTWVVDKLWNYYNMYKEIPYSIAFFQQGNRNIRIGMLLTKIFGKHKRQEFEYWMTNVCKIEDDDVSKISDVNFLHLIQCNSEIWIFKINSQRIKNRKRILYTNYLILSEKSLYRAALEPTFYIVTK